ncbi:hypothetical protein [Nocardia sp. NPDC049526]
MATPLNDQGRSMALTMFIAALHYQETDVSGGAPAGPPLCPPE